MSDASALYGPGLAVTLILYAVVFWLGAVVACRRAGGSSAQLLLAGRTLPLWLGAGTMAATWVGGGYLNGTAEATYAAGLVQVQAPWGYALSLVIGGLVFAPIMRRHGFTTMLDPFQERFGRRLTAVLYLPALAGEIFWSAAILTALGTTFGTILGVDFEVAIVVSAAIAIAYTLLGGLWAVALTDIVQLGLLLGGLWLAATMMRSGSGETGGIGEAWGAYRAAFGESASLLPPWGGWRAERWGAAWWSWWDGALLLVFGGIPWQVYFQRVLASRDEATARRLSLAAAAVCVVAALPAVLIGIHAHAADWASLGIAPPEPALVLPTALRYLTPSWVAAIGLGALAAAVMSSVDSSFLSAAGMGTWNVYRPLRAPEASPERIAVVLRRSIVLVGVAATLLALRVRSVYALWFLCSDLVYCLLFSQLVAVLFDRRANRYGSAAGLAVAAFLRLGGGEPALGLPRLLPYPMVDAATDAVLFPFRTTAMLAGLLTILVVSRLTGRLAPPRPLAPPPATG